MQHIHKFIINAIMLCLPLLSVMVASVSAFIEFKVFNDLLGMALLAFVLVLSLEGMKISLLIYYAIAREQIGRLGRVAYHSLQFVLLAISFVASCALFAQVLDRPNLEAVRKAEVARIEVRYDRFIADARNDAMPELEKRIQDRDSEENYTYSNGTFVGPRYRERDRLYKEAKKELEDKIAQLENEKEEAIQSAKVARYVDNEEIYNQTITPLMNLLEEMVGQKIPYWLAGLLLSGFLALAMELAILVGLYVYGEVNGGVLSLIHESKKVKDGFAAAKMVHSKS